jgi:outer membrane protein OmpA-like peptidoglycan-associated protein
MNTSKHIPRSGTLAVLLIGAGLGVAHADDATAVTSAPSRQSNLGAVTGLALGAAAGGPLGAVVGLTVGVVAGDHYHRQQQAAASVRSSLQKSETERAQLTQSLTRLDASLAQAQAQQARLGQTLQRADQIGLDVGFRTNEDAIPEQAMAPLLKIGALAADMPETVVRVAGYADPRGSDEYNDALSLRRAQAVAALLTAAGVPAGRIIIEAHGKSESQSEAGDVDGYALERRVSVRLEQGGAVQVASRG